MLYSFDFYSLYTFLCSVLIITSGISNKAQMIEMMIIKGVPVFFHFYLISCVVSPNNTDEGSRMLVKLQRLP